MPQEDNTIYIKGQLKGRLAQGQEGLEAFVESLPQTFAAGGETLHEGRNTVKAFTVNGRRLVVKRYKRPTIVQRVAYTFFKKSKAERAFIYAAELRRRGFDTPREMAFALTLSGGLMEDGYFVSAECTLPPVSDLLNRPDFDRHAASAVARLVARLHSNGVLHGDLNLTNILYSVDAQGRFAFCLIDTNRSKFGQPSVDECVDNMKRLTHNRGLLAYITAEYAAARGMDADKLTAAVMERLDKFERKRAMIGRMKRLAGRKKKR